MWYRVAGYSVYMSSTMSSSSDSDSSHDRNSRYILLLILTSIALYLLFEYECIVFLANLFLQWHLIGIMNSREIIVPPRDLEKEKRIELYHKKKEQARLKYNEQLLTGSSSSSSISRRRPPIDPSHVCILIYVIIFLFVIVM